jgi:uncharacterized secreted protein with C-terminal beta-propeller domain
MGLLLRTTSVLLATGLAAAGCAADDPDGATPATGDRPTTTVGATTTAATWETGTTEPGRPRDTNPPTGPFGRSLVFFDGCPALLDHLQGVARERVTPWGFGGWYLPMAGAESAMDDTAGGAPTTAAAAEEPAALDPDVSGTNTQEADVDEGDVVETDGTHVYLADGVGVRIVEVARAAVVAQLDVPAGDHELILDGDRLAVVTRSWHLGDDTVISVYDVSTPASPVLLGRSHLEGSSVAVRSAEGTMRVVMTSSSVLRLPFVSPDRFGYDEARALEENRRIIDATVIEDWLPRTFSEGPDGSFGPMQPALDCTRIGVPSTFSGLGIAWIASVDLDGDPTPAGTAGVVSSGETVYASTSSLYLATVPWDWYHPWEGSTSGPVEQPPTSIHRFELGAGTDVAYVASGTVPGRLLNQFSMSEFEGVLRVATTVDVTSGGMSESFVHTLTTEGDELRPLAAVGGLGRGEQIYAVRFLGPTAYVVTFRQVDPLYVLDLTDPAAPALRGELKIPGYSAYLHPVGDGLLLGVGQDATDTGQTLGTQLSLFDVTDPANPLRVATLPIGGSSDAEWDHRAFLFWPADGTIVIPVSPWWGGCGPAVDCLAGSIVGDGGAAVVARLEGTSLIPVGTIEHRSSPNGCWNALRRSMVIGSELVTVGSGQVRFSDRATLAERASATWTDDGSCGYWID